MAKAFIAAVPLALLVVAGVVVAVALTSGALRFDSWPSSPDAPPRANAVVIEQPLELDRSARGRGAAPVARDRRAARRRVERRSGRLVARAERVAPKAARAPVAEGGAIPRGGSVQPVPDLAVTAPQDFPGGTDVPTPATPAPVPQQVEMAPDEVAVDPVLELAEPDVEVDARTAAPTTPAAAPEAEPIDADEADDHWVLRGPRTRPGRRGEGKGRRDWAR